MSTLEYILIFTFIGSIGSLCGGILLISNKKLALKISHFLASFAAGTFLGAAFFDLIPEALHEAEEVSINVPLWILVGIISFFLIERFIHWFHHHESYHIDKKESKSTVPLIILGDTIHNFVDGVAIAATFMIDIQLGIVTTLAVAAHEIPQEIGDFGLLLHKGVSRKKTVIVNVVSAAVAFLGAISTYLFGNRLENYLPVVVSLTAGFFIYIATSDLIPEIHYEKRKGYAFLETLILLIGVLFIWVVVNQIQGAH